MRQQIKVDGEWVIGTPGPKEWYKQEVALNIWQEQHNMPVVIKAPVVIRLITKRAFMQRFTQAERMSFRQSAGGRRLDAEGVLMPLDEIVLDIHEDLLVASNVDLDLSDVRNGLLYMVAIGILEESRVDELLVDGTVEETWP